MFEDLNLELANAAMQPIDENIPFVVETDASDFAISQAPVEKEAQAIVEAIHHWIHFYLEDISH